MYLKGGRDETEMKLYLLGEGMGETLLSLKNRFFSAL